MTEKKTSDAQVKASRKWEEKNPDRKRYIRYRSNARTFVRHWANEEDLQELIEIYKKENPNAEKRRGEPPLLNCYQPVTNG